MRLKRALLLLQKFNFFSFNQQGFILAFRRKELEQFLKIREVVVKGLKPVLQAKALEIVVEADWKTLNDIRNTQLGIKDSHENNPESSNETTQATKPIENIPEPDECILIEEKPIEDDKTGLFSIKHKIFNRTCLPAMCSRYRFVLSDAQYLEILEGRTNVDGGLKFDVQLQLRFFENDLTVDSVSQGAKCWLNGAQIPIMVRRHFFFRIIFFINFYLYFLGWSWRA